ncbi:fatty acid hydroxylase [Chloroherpeton thalassium ATCC 35110]|uniref:Fatty acid hydroxylase n=1 Tax=Chloroherpeton thalassium (strain ATCC 35110 / GB-78) TaxID=517418 RepID=B3QY56_CHLT3|nr:sterol desaturase family protein [Chloroherpeton thalassium]ACF15022.1 fatty acid hydroxylase [Chloroherpeton thalassium ATCC 35110]
MPDAEQLLQMLTTPEVIATAIIIASALVYIILERFFPYSKDQKFLRNGFFNDLVMYTLLQTYLLGFAINFLIKWMDSTSGLSRLQLVSDWPIWAQLLFFTIVHDFYIYWFHRWQHRNEYLWRLHEAHHSVTAVDWLAGSRSHALEILINQTVEFAPIVLLGAAPEVALYKGVIDAVWGMYIHANLNVKSGFMVYIINGPEQHRWHHAIEITAGGINYGTKLAIWDTLFDTLVMPKEKPKGYGITNEYPLSDSNAPILTQFWQDFVNYFRQQFYAFRPMKQPSEA